MKAIFIKNFNRDVSFNDLDSFEAGTFNGLSSLKKL